MGPEKLQVNWLTTNLETIARPTNAPTSARKPSFVETLVSGIGYCNIEIFWSS